MIWLYLLVTTHITITFFSLYVHRGMAHQQYVIHPVLGHIMRFWLWLTDGTGVREWVAIHHNHHRYSDNEGDPHIFFVTGTPWERIKFTAKIAYKSIVHGYKGFASNNELDLYANHVENHWLYEKHQRVGIILLLLMNLVLFGYVGFLVWLIQISWVTIWMTVIVAVGAHHFGYKDKLSPDNSRNLFPIGIITVGEELHNNHHRHPGNPKLNSKWFEFDLGWIYIRILSFFGLIKLKT